MIISLIDYWMDIKGNDHLQYLLSQYSDKYDECPVFYGFKALGELGDRGKGSDEDDGTNKSLLLL